MKKVLDSVFATLLMTIFLSTSLTTLHANVTAIKKPNVVFILADDLGWNDLSNEGSNYYESPNIDRIANSGMKFTRGYAACQVCSPSRASIMTGTYPTKHGITSHIGAPSGEGWRKWNRFDSHLPPAYERRLRAKETTLAEVFRDAGYETFFAGKWHLGSEGSWPTDHGFKINKGGWDTGSPMGGFFAPWRNPNLKPGPNGQSLPIRLGQETAQFIDANKDKPFFAFLSFYSVHSPIQTTPKLWKKYRDKAEKLGLVDKRFIFDRRLPVRQVQDCPIYAGMIESMDDAVGIVLKKLDELGLADNTIICFTSDNGGVSSGDAYATSNLPLRGGKGRQWEGGIREPYYLYAPGVTRNNSKSNVCVHGIDWYPTLCDLANINVPKEQSIDGVSLVPLLKGDEIKKRALFWHYPHYGNQGGEPSSIIIDGDYKLILYHEDRRTELYNVTEDQGEQNDLATQEKELAVSMLARLNQWLKETNAEFPTKDPKFESKKRDQRWHGLKTKMMDNLEKRHRDFLNEKFKPNKDWWQSTPVSPSVPTKD